MIELRQFSYPRFDVFPGGVESLEPGSLHDLTILSKRRGMLSDHQTKPNQTPNPKPKENFYSHNLDYKKKAVFRNHTISKVRFFYVDFFA